METKVRNHDYVYINTFQVPITTSSSLEMELKLYVTIVTDQSFWFKLYATAKNTGSTTIDFNSTTIEAGFDADTYSADATAYFRNGTIAPNETMTVISEGNSARLPFNQNVVTTCRIKMYSITVIRKEDTFYFIPSEPIYYNGIQVNSVYYNGTQANSITYNGTPL